MKTLKLPVLILTFMIFSCETRTKQDFTEKVEKEGQVPSGHFATKSSEESKKECCSKRHGGSENNKKISRPGKTLPEISDLSVYNLESTWMNQRSEVVKLADFSGKIQLVAMIYTECAYACPRIVADLKRIEDALGSIKKEEVEVILISMDAERDTPEKLLNFAQKNKLGPERWVLLTSSEDNILEVAALLNVKFKKEINGNISHSNIITVLNVNGEIINQQEGLGIDPEESVNAIVKLLKNT